MGRSDIGSSELAKELSQDVGSLMGEAGFRSLLVGRMEERLSIGANVSVDIHGLFEELLNRGRLHALAVTSDGFAFDPQSGQSFSVNKSGAAALELMRNTRCLERSVAELARQFDVPYAFVRGSVEVFVRQLARFLA
jgi:hypothetical protein